MDIEMLILKGFWDVLFVVGMYGYVWVDSNDFEDLKIWGMFWFWVYLELDFPDSLSMSSYINRILSEPVRTSYSLPFPKSLESFYRSFLVSKLMYEKEILEKITAFITWTPFLLA
ncbi:predicted protein [Sclerotinia sclerotiorum 1980 UF-70]|uniref:Uncharacterized protein n=1 Tax=Sclerotinia sclerotiorum (strain ATCC 18683 / 1980 / Ss-1) TaxID=665079 RepID=A7EMZ8_SCLS1|nr:predicted protein [Sclerotinia sclerotiorum 1980 UF-70]EDO04214.1 predicted protein [Sclerotinia sclerotiorum 1980 UF-70]